MYFILESKIVFISKLAVVSHLKHFSSLSGVFIKTVTCLQFLVQKHCAPLTGALIIKHWSLIKNTSLHFISLVNDYKCFFLKHDMHL